MSKLNIRSDLWQKPKEQTKFEDLCWYEDQVVSYDPINELMKRLSADTKLSMIYINDSITATSTTKVDESGSEAHHIQAILHGSHFSRLTKIPDFSSIFFHFSSIFLMFCFLTENLSHFSK